MAKKPKNPEYELLKAVWYNKLKQDGFNDIETDEYSLKEWTIGRGSQYDQTTWEARETYYNLARRFLSEFKFASNLEQIIWEYHTEGVGVRNIAKLLEDVGIKTNRTSINATIQRLAHIMKLKYLPGYKETYE